VLWAFQLPKMLAISRLAQKLFIGKACARGGALTQHLSDSRQITLTAMKTRAAACPMWNVQL
jgi:hypothetical protein